LQFLDVRLGFNEEIFDPELRFDMPDRIPVGDIAGLGPELQVTGLNT
jgi:hypothetical protein